MTNPYEAVACVECGEQTMACRPVCSLCEADEGLFKPVVSNHKESKMALKFDPASDLIKMTMVLTKDGGLTTELERSSKCEYGLVEHLAAGMCERAKVELLNQAYSVTDRKATETGSEEATAEAGKELLTKLAKNGFVPNLQPEEWRAIAKKHRPEMTDEECDQHWERFCKIVEKAKDSLAS